MNEHTSERRLLICFFYRHIVHPSPIFFGKGTWWKCDCHVISDIWSNLVTTLLALSIFW